MIHDTEFILINLYSANTKNDQLTTFSELTKLLENFDHTENKPIIFAGDFNLFLDRSLEAKGDNPCLKKHNYQWIWNPKAKQYTFRQQHFSGFIQRRLDYIFISQNFQEIAVHTIILNPISTDQSRVLCSFQNVLCSL